MIDFLAILGLLTLALGATLGLAGLYVFYKHHKNGALFLGTILTLLGLGILFLASKLSVAIEPRSPSSKIHAHS
ncbi:MAG: hypothetical protein ACN4GG_09575 [Akkermansiaceae bacterium]